MTTLNCRACGVQSAEMRAELPGWTAAPEADGWLWTDNLAFGFFGYWLCPACAATPEESAVIVALRKPSG